MPYLFNDLYIKFDYVLGYAKSIEIVHDNEINCKIFSYDTFYKIQKDKFSNLDYNSLSISDYKNLNDYLFLQTKSNV